MSMYPAAYSWVWCNLNCRSGSPHNAAHFPSYSLWACTMCSVRYWGEPKRAPHKWCQSRFSICIYIYISAVHHSVYTCLLFQRYVIFLPLCACAYDVCESGANTSTKRKRANSVTSRLREAKKGRKTAKMQEHISEIGELQRLRLRGARLQRKIRRSRQAEHLWAGKTFWVQRVHMRHWKFEALKSSSTSDCYKQKDHRCTMSS